jgi:hypothetical protein
MPFVACSAYTKRGDPCRNCAKEGSPWCGVHRNMTPEDNDRLRTLRATDREALQRVKTFYETAYPTFSDAERRIQARAALKRFEQVLEMEHMDPENRVVLLDAVLAPDRATQQRIIQENGIVNASDANLKKMRSALEPRRGCSKFWGKAADSFCGFFCMWLGPLCAAVVA